MKSSGSKAAAREDLLPIAVDNPNARWQEVFQSMAQYSIEPNEITGILKAVFEELVKTSQGLNRKIRLKVCRAQIRRNSPGPLLRHFTGVSRLFRWCQALGSPDIS